MINRRSNKPPQVTDHDRLRWERIQEHLDALEALTEAEQEDYLDSACLDPELRREVLAFHRARAASTSYLDDLAESFAPKSVSTPDLSGKRIGAYRLLKLLGRGGMGMVYEAERADGTFEQRVALKLLSTALSSGDAHQRFLAERQILAELEHPSIARILDGGVTGDGTPWFAMERVEGLPIDVYCDRHELDIRQRLELFLQVCDAVEHAHRRLVVHRDLKPANVLVATNDPQHSLSPEGRGSGFEVATVKLLDFGIAKLLDADAAPVTRTSSRMMTPEYASPEQVREEPVTTASDVYQLGLLLYELLTGHRPYLLRHLSAGELERVICEQPPTRLSSAVTREDTIVGGPPDRGPGHASGPTSKGRNRAKPEEIGPEGPPTDTLTNTGRDAISALCQARRTSPAKLRRRLRGDLENIVSKALSKEPKRRYGSADRLAQDIRRHLTGLPVNARVDTWAYRSRKFFQRHAMGAAAAAVVVTLVTGITGFYLVHLQRAYEQAEVERAQTQVERDRAETALVQVEAEAAKAQQMSEFLTGMFRSVDPRETLGAEITARELLDRGVEQVDRDLTAQPEIQANMLQVLGRTYMDLGLYNSAEALLSRTLELRRDLLGQKHPDIAETLHEIGKLLVNTGRTEQALEQLEEAAGILSVSPDGDTSELGDVLRALGAAYHNIGEYDEAQEALEQALSIQLEASGENSEPVAEIRFRLGLLLPYIDNEDQAETYLEQALAYYEQTYGPNHPRIADPLAALAVLRQWDPARHAVNDSRFRRSLAILEDTYGSDHPRVGDALTRLGLFLVISGQVDKAIEILQQARTIYMEALGQDHHNLVYAFSPLGAAYLADNRPRDAADQYRRAIALREKVSSRQHFDGRLFHLFFMLALAETALDDATGAEQTLEQALTLWQRTPENRHAAVEATLLELTRWITALRQCEHAIPLVERAIEFQTTRQPASGEPIDALKNLLAECEAA